MLIINDLHIGFRRVGGTTPASQEAMRTYLLTSLQSALHSTNETDLVIAGDLFDDFEVSPRDWVEVYLTLSAWLDLDRTLTLVAGNHDHSAKAERVSSFEMLSCVLAKGRNTVLTVGVDQWGRHPTDNVIFLAHCTSQVIFDAKLAEVLVEVKQHTDVILHANFDNNFAARSDHSLNVTRDQAQAFIDKGARLIFAHEHQAREQMKGNVVVLGNQWPTSIADCLNNERKHMYTLYQGTLTAHETWTRDALAGHCGYEEIDWRNLSDPVIASVKFIRVVGQASSNEAGEVISAISKFRQQSSCFVVTNAVAIDGIVTSEELPEAFEAATRFDVMDFIRRNLDEAEMAAVNQLVEQT